MSISQVSMFLQNRPGHFTRVLKTLESRGINVRGFSLSDTGDYGIARFIVDDPQAALEILKDQGAATTITEVLCLKLSDEPGELLRVMELLSSCDVNVVYSYSLISTYIALYVDDVQAAEKILAEQPVELISQEQISSAVA